MLMHGCPLVVPCDLAACFLATVSAANNQLMLLNPHPSCQCFRGRRRYNFWRMIRTNVNLVFGFAGPLHPYEFVIHFDIHLSIRRVKPPPSLPRLFIFISHPYLGLTTSSPRTMDMTPLFHVGIVEVVMRVLRTSRTGFFFIFFIHSRSTITID